ncbi:MAG: exonuclease domain-containing protein [Patescibacteria group bacterium]
MISIDVESTGLDAREASIISLGAVDTDDPTNQFYDECRAWDGAAISDDALAINGFSREEILGETSEGRAKKTEAELIRDFVAWATDRPRDRTLLAQNVAFDRDFVTAACRRAGIEFPFAYRTLDTHSLCWLHMTARGLTPPVQNQRSAINLDYILTYCGLPGEPKPHNGLTGALSHAEVFSRIAYTKKLIPDFFAYDIPWIHET